MLKIKNEFLTTREIAKLCGVSPTTVIRWIDSGMLPAFKLPSGHRRARYAEVRSFLERFEMPVPENETHIKKKVFVGVSGLMK